jgi:SAM-dependent methyltransferase
MSSESVRPVHGVAARGFGAAGEAYERGRPDYPPAAVAALLERLEAGPGARVVDLGAGTGKLTRRLTSSGATLLAIEPVAAMRATFARLLPAVPLLGGAAEAIPLRDGSAQAVVVGTAFHWFDGPAALAELHRVLAPGGRLGLVWLARDETVDWVARLVRLVDGYKRGAPPRYAGGTWQRVFEAPPPGVRFTPLQSLSFPFVQSAPREIALQRVASTSFVGALTAEEQQEVLRRVRDLLDGHPQTRDRQTLDLPYTADVYWCTRAPA